MVTVVLWLLPDSPDAPELVDVPLSPEPEPVDVTRPDLTVLSMTWSSPNAHTSNVRVSK
ncbi:hypothetical protein D3C78_1719200 [compost metagenome]